MARLHQENEAKDKLLNDSKSTIKKHEQDLTLAVAQEALRGIQMMEKMEKSIEERKGREVGLMGKLKMAMKETVANKEWEEKLAEVEAEAQEREKRDATEIEELRKLLNERQEHAHAADDIAAGLTSRATARPPRRPMRRRRMAALPRRPRRRRWRWSARGQASS